MEKNKEIGRNLLGIQNLYIEMIVTMFGVFLLLLTFFMTITQGEPKDLNSLIDYFRTHRTLLILHYFGLIITFIGISFMIFSFYQSWKDAINKVYEKIK